jgi:hypothetical protein
VDKQTKTAAELEEIVKQRLGAGDFKVTVHRNLRQDGTPRFMGVTRQKFTAVRSWPKISSPSCRSTTISPTF